MSIFRESFLEEPYVFESMLESINVELLQEAFDKEKIINNIKEMWKRFVKWFKEKCKEIREFIRKILKKNKIEDKGKEEGKEETIVNNIEYKCISDDDINKFKKYINSTNNVIRIKIDLNNKSKMKKMIEELENIGILAGELKEYEDIILKKKGTYKDLEQQNKKLSNLCNEINSLINNAESYINSNITTHITNDIKIRLMTAQGYDENEDLKNVNKIVMLIIQTFKTLVIDFRKYSITINSVINYNNSL